MDIAALRALIDATPEVAGLSDQDTAAWLNEPRDVVPDLSVYVRTTDLYVVLGMDATGVIAALRDSAHPTKSALHKDVYQMILPASPGVQIAHPVAQAMLATLVSDGICSQAQADAITAFGSRTVSRAAANGLGRPTTTDVRNARAL